jgi:hypothetical protein
MADQFSYDLQQLLKLFQETWAERDAFRINEGIEASGHGANWGTVLLTAHRSAQELFQPAPVDLDNDVPAIDVLERLLERLAKSRR